MKCDWNIICKSLLYKEAVSEVWKKLPNSSAHKKCHRSTDGLICKLTPISWKQNWHWAYRNEHFKWHIYSWWRTSILKSIHNCRRYGPNKFGRTHIHQTVVVTIMSRSLQAGLTEIEMHLWRPRKHCGIRRKWWLSVFSPFPLNVFKRLSFSELLKVGILLERVNPFSNEKC